MRRRFARSGIAAVQWIILAALIILVIAGTVANLGTRANVKLNQTATDVANPASLKNRFGS